MAERNAFGKSGFRPYQKGLDDHPRPPTYPEQRHVRYRVNADGNTYREEIEDDRNYGESKQVNSSHNRDVLNPSKTQDRDMRGTRAIHVEYPEPIKIQSQRPVTYRVQADGKTYRDQSEEGEYNRKYGQANHQQNRDDVVHGQQPKPKLPQRPVTYRVQADGKTYREQSEEGQYNRKYGQANHQQDRDDEVYGQQLKPNEIRPQIQTVDTEAVTVGYQIGQYNRKYGQANHQQDRDDEVYGQQLKPNEIRPQGAVTYRVLPDGKTYREQSDYIRNGRKYEDANPVPQKPDFVDKNIRGTRVMQAQQPEPSKFQAKEDPMDAPVKDIMEKTIDGIGKGKIHRWTMFRLWVNREISQEVRKERDASTEFKKRLDLPMDSMVTSVLVDPASDTNGRRLQDEYGAKANGVQHFNILPENLYFVFGIPRANTSTDASVSEFLETMSNAVAKSEQDVLSTKDEFPIEDDNGFRRTRGLGPQVDQNKSGDHYDKHLKGKANDDEKYRRWHADDLKTSRYKHADGIGENGKDLEDDRVKKPGQWEADILGKSRKWQSDDAQKHSPKLLETDNDWNIRQWDDNALGKSRARGTDDLRKSRVEEFTDFGKYHFDSYEMPNKKRKDNLSNTRTAGESTYATHVNK